MKYARKFAVPSLGIALVIGLVFFFLAPIVLGVRVFTPLALASWSLGALSVAGFLLIGKRIWWAWFINILSQVCWILFWILDRQPGLIITNVVYIMVFAQNAINWAHEYNVTDAGLPKRDRKLGSLRDGSYSRRYGVRVSDEDEETRL